MLDLERVLQLIVDRVRDLADAQYAALGILDAEGRALERFVTSGVSLARRRRTGDPRAAVRARVPHISGTGLDGQPLDFGPDGPMAIVVLAHWCPQCQAELPRIAQLIADGGVPEGVAVAGISTAIDPVRPNFPPSAWFERERWTQPTVHDDAESSALHALGLNSFPGFVFVDAQGTVVVRLTGEIGVEQFRQVLASLAP